MASAHSHGMFAATRPRNVPGAGIRPSGRPRNRGPRRAGRRRSARFSRRAASGRRRAGRRCLRLTRGGAHRHGQHDVPADPAARVLERGGWLHDAAQAAVAAAPDVAAAVADLRQGHTDRLEGGDLVALVEERVGLRKLRLGPGSRLLRLEDEIGTEIGTGAGGRRSGLDILRACAFWEERQGHQRGDRADGNPLGTGGLAHDRPTHRTAPNETRQRFMSVSEQG